MLDMVKVPELEVKLLTTSQKLGPTCSECFIAICVAMKHCSLVRIQQGMADTAVGNTISQQGSLSSPFFYVET